MFNSFSVGVGAILLFAGCVSAISDTSISSLASRQAGPSTSNCSAACAPLENAKANCVTPHCACTIPYLQAQGDCLLCQSNTPEDEASVQFLLDVEMVQCHEEHIKISFQLDLPPAAAAIVQKFNSDSASLRRTQTAYLALQIAGGHIGLVVVLVYSVFSNKINRDPTYINFCITWIFSSVAYSLLLYRGTTDNNVINALGKVLPTICLQQAALTEGAQVMTAASTLALIIQLWITLRVAVNGENYGPKRARWTTVVLLMIPYILFIAFSLSAVFVGSKHILVDDTTPQRALPTKFYCIVFSLNPFLQAIYGVSVILLTLTVIFDALIISILLKNWAAFRGINAESSVSLSILIRFVAFSIYRVVVAVAYVSVLSRLPQLNSDVVKTSLPSVILIPTWVDMLQAAIPLVAFLVLGVNDEMLTSLKFWRSFRCRQGSKYAS